MKRAIIWGLQEGTAFRSGQHFVNFYCTSFKTNIYRDTEGTVNIEKSAICIDTFLRF